jgi:hypothetical protein
LTLLFVADAATPEDASNKALDLADVVVPEGATAGTLDWKIASTLVCGLLNAR